MSRLIDADELKKAEKRIATMPWGDWNGNKVEFTWTSHEVQRLIDKAPTIDAVEVVRCSECKYVGYDATTFLVCDRKGMGLKPFHVYHDDYCSYGERREDGDTE